MDDMTNEQHEQFLEVMFQKYGGQWDWYETKEESIRSIIGGVIADTYLLCTDSVTLAQWLEASKEAV